MSADGRSASQGLAAVERLATMLHGGEEERRPDTEGIERALIGGVCSVISRCLLRGESPAGLEPQLLFLVLAPYLGVDEAARMAPDLGRRLGQSYS